MPTRRCDGAIDPKHFAVLGEAVVRMGPDLKPHLFGYWLTRKQDPVFYTSVADFCAVYRAPAAADNTHRTISIDEMPHPGLGEHRTGARVMPGKAERCKFEYKRHGTQPFPHQNDLTI